MSSIINLGYRQLVPVVEELYDWDVILLYGDVKLIGMSLTHLPDCGREMYTCQCLNSPRLTSPVVDAWTRPLRESTHEGDPVTGEARHLLALDAGDEVPVLSGKTYRLAGPRKVAGYDGFASGSIFRVYAEDVQKEPWAPWWRRVLAFISRKATWMVH
jgi:hypothetical protein